MKYRKKMIFLAAGLLVLAALAGCGKSEVVTDAQQETAASGAAGTNTNAGSGADASGQAGQSAGNDTAAGDGKNAQAGGVNAPSAVPGGGISSGNTAAGGAANGASTAGKTGWVEEKDGWHLYDAQGTSMTGWVENEGSRYYFDRDGVMLTDWQEVNGSWFFLGEDGVMRKGWQRIDGGDFYLDETNGAMQHDVWVGEYYLGSDGHMLTDTTTPDGSVVGSDGRRVSLEELFNRKKADLDAKAEVDAQSFGESYYHLYKTSGHAHYTYLEEDIDEDGIPELIANIIYYEKTRYCQVFALRNGALKEIRFRNWMGEESIEARGTGYMSPAGYFIASTDEYGLREEYYYIPKGDVLEEVHFHVIETSGGTTVRLVGIHAAEQELPRGGDYESICEFDDTEYPTGTLATTQVVNKVQNHMVGFVDSPGKYMYWPLSDLEASFGSPREKGSAFDNLWFEDSGGALVYYSFDGTDLIFGMFADSMKVISISSNNPHNFFRYDGELTLDAVIELAGDMHGKVSNENYEDDDEDFITYDRYLPEAFDTEWVHINSKSLCIDYRKSDGVVTAVYYYGDAAG